MMAYPLRIGDRNRDLDVSAIEFASMYLGILSQCPHWVNVTRAG